jgi:hypothetical protein
VGSRVVSTTPAIDEQAVEPDFGATFASSQVDGSAARKCFHYA